MVTNESRTASGVGRKTIITVARYLRYGEPKCKSGLKLNGLSHEGHEKNVQRFKQTTSASRAIIILHGNFTSPQNNKTWSVFVTVHFGTAKTKNTPMT
jgi:hypothetical protein